MLYKIRRRPLRGHDPRRKDTYPRLFRRVEIKGIAVAFVNIHYYYIWTRYDGSHVSFIQTLLPKGPPDLTK